MLLKDKCILVTGGNGFIGQHLTRELKKDCSNLHIIDVKMSSDKDVKEHIGDLKDSQFVDEIIDKINPNVIFHLAADKSRTQGFEQFESSISNNIFATLNIFSASTKLKKLDNIVILGTAEEYGTQDSPFLENYREEPITPYSFSKMCVTHFSQLMNRLYNIPTTIIRPSLAYGYGQGREMFLPALIESLLEDKIFDMTKGEQLRDFIYIDDLVSAVLRAGELENARGEIINIGSGEPVSLKHAANFIQTKLNKKDLVKFGNVEYRKNEIMAYSVDIKKARKVLNWEPRFSFEEGIQKVLESYLEKI